MKTRANEGADSEMKPEYDFSGGVRGKYAKAYAEGTNVVLLDPEVAREFPDSRSVNEALRALLPILRRHGAGKRGYPTQVAAPLAVREKVGRIAKA